MLPLTGMQGRHQILGDVVPPFDIHRAAVWRIKLVRYFMQMQTAALQHLLLVSLLVCIGPTCILQKFPESYLLLEQGLLPLQQETVLYHIWSDHGMYMGLQVNTYSAE